ncbi:MAG: hypothetical protein RMN51_00690 [Verrucomicrobiota bacterium]|nr:hypothetical protein [Limisphaera sp.]MDW8380617.1 hypothetical protein [Verrucomicrobiota bacterium]
MDPVQRFIGRMPLRIALAGGWIDQPFVSRHNPDPPGSMVVVSLVPNFRPMDRAGFATGTRAIARRIWKDRLPNRPREQLVRELYSAENQGRPDPSGSQDMIGLIYPGISRLDYDVRIEGGVFPAHIETIVEPRTVRWLQKVLYLLPVEPRPEGYYPLGRKNLDPKWVARLGQSGRDCFNAIRKRDTLALGQSFNACMACWNALLPDTLEHPSLRVDLKALLRAYQRRYPGAMYSGCGGGYLFVVSEEPVPGGFQVSIRTS